jgi:pentapeptide MXKDX repeat protein
MSHWFLTSVPLFACVLFCSFGCGDTPTPKKEADKMAKDKMEGDKMSKDKMEGNKMAKDKMEGDKMSKDKMEK